MSGALNGLRILVVRWGDVSHMNNVITLVNFMAQEGCEATLITVTGSSQPPQALNRDVRFLCLNNPGSAGLRKILQLLASAWKLKKQLKSQKWDILYVIDSWTLPLIWLANNFVFRKKGLPFIYHTFDWLEPGLHSEIHLKFEAAACRAADLVINADRARARLQKTFYRLKNTPMWLKNGLSRATKTYQRDPQLRADLLGEGAPDNSIIVVYPTVAAGHDSFQRMTLELIESFVLLPKNYYLVTFFREGDYYRRCQGVVKDNQLSSRIKFLSPVPFLELFRYLACADVGAIFYNDSLSSGYFMCNADKLSLFAANGIPFVSSDFPNLEAIVYKHQIGICCDANFPEKIACAIREICESPPGLELRKSHARKVFLEYLCFETQSENYVSSLNKIINNNQCDGR